MNGIAHQLLAKAGHLVISVALTEMVERLEPDLLAVESTEADLLARPN